MHTKMEDKLVCPRITRSDIECASHEYVRQMNYDYASIPLSKTQQICCACAKKYTVR